MIDKTVTRQNKRKKAPLIATLIMLSVAISACFYWFSYAQYFETTENAYLQGNITTISPKIAGFIIKSYVKDNQRVKQGDLLVEIDSRDYVAALHKANAHIKVVESGVHNLMAKQILQKSLIKQAQSRVDSAQVEYDHLERQVSRFRSLLKQNYASHDEVDRVLADQKVSLSQLNEAKANLVATNEQFNVIASEIEQAKASVTEARAQLEQAQIDLDNTKVYAPIDGVLGKRSVREGMLVQNGTQLMSIVPSNEIWIEANFKETQIKGIHQGQSVEVKLDAYPNQPLKGVVDSFSPATGAKFALLPPENATGNFTKIVQRVPVKIIIPKQDKLHGHLMPGLSAVVIIDKRG